MKPARLADMLRLIAAALDDGTYTAALTRTAEWHDLDLPSDDPEPPRCKTCADDPEPCADCRTLRAAGVSDHDAKEHAAIAAASRLHTEITTIHRTLERTSDRMVRLLTIANPDRQLLRPATPTDYALAGWCRSCSRNDGHLSPIATRPDGSRRYRDLCNGCGEWAASHDGQHPPLDILRLRHAGKRVTAADYRRIMGRDPAA